MAKIIRVDEDTLIDDRTIRWVYTERNNSDVQVSYSKGENAVLISDCADKVGIFVNDIPLLIKALTLADKHIIDSEQ